MEFVYECEDFIPKEFCENLIKKIENEGYLEPGLTAGGVQLHIKKGYDVKVHKKQWEQELNFIRSKTGEMLDKYKKHLIDSKLYNQMQADMFIDSINIDVAQIQQTRTGGFYRWHMDSALNGCSRVLAFIIYLNDMSEEDGGSTDFLGKSVRPKAGKLLMFPTTWTYLHRGKKVENGTKYIFAGFGYAS